MQSVGFGWIFPFFLEKKVIGAFPLEGSEGKTFYCTCNRKELLAFPSNPSSSPSFFLSSVAKAKENSFFFCPAAGYPLLSPEGGLAGEGMWSTIVSSSSENSFGKNLPIKLLSPTLGQIRGEGCDDWIFNTFRTVSLSYEYLYEARTHKHTHTSARNCQ